MIGKYAESIAKTRRQNQQKSPIQNRNRFSFKWQRTPFEGLVKGEITMVKSGKDGFGYDPIFVPEGYTKTFVEMTLKDKNTISHRAIAVKKLATFLNTAFK